MLRPSKAASCLTFIPIQKYLGSDLELPRVSGYTPGF